MVFDMPVQATNTLYSLSPGYQRGVNESDYEVIVVENSSERNLQPPLGANVRYLRRDESGKSPAAAVNAGVAAARGSAVAVMVDGARMVTPGVVLNLLRAQRIARCPVVSVPGYHLGDQLHQDAAASGYSAEQEQSLLAGLDWRADGYRLFTRAVPSASCADGYLVPIAESNCVGVPKKVFDRLGGFDENFVSTGGGFVNLDFYRRAVDLPRATLVVLPGEGAFHQFHGGVTTGAAGTDHDAIVEQMRQEYQRLRGRAYQSPAKSPVLLGEVPPAAAPFLERSAAALAGRS